MVIFVDPKDPNLDLSKYDPEELVSAVLVQPDPNVKDEPSTFDQKIEAERRIKALLSEEQWMRRCGPLNAIPISSLSAEEQEDINRAIRNRRKTRENLRKIRSYKILKSSDDESNQGEWLSGPEEPDEGQAVDEVPGSLLSEGLIASEETKQITEHLVRILDTLSTNGITANSQLSELREANSRLSTQATEAEEKARTARRGATVTAIIAVLSLTVAAAALLKPVSIEQSPDRPVPVQIMEPSRGK